MACCQKRFWIGLVGVSLAPAWPPATAYSVLPRELVPQPLFTSAMQSVQQQKRNRQASCTASHGLTRFSKKSVRFGRDAKKGSACNGATLPRHCEPLFTPAGNPPTIHILDILLLTCRPFALFAQNTSSRRGGFRTSSQAPFRVCFKIPSLLISLPLPPHSKNVADNLLAIDKTNGFCAVAIDTQERSYQNSAASGS